MKKILTIILIVSCMTATCYAQTFTVDGLEYVVTSTSPNEVRVNGATTTTPNVVIPETVTDNGTIYDVKTIRTDAFRNDQITSVTIPASIRNIGSNAFRNSALISVTSNNPTAPTIGNNAFLGTPDNIALIIPSGSEASYDAAGWNSYFFIINGVPRIGAEFNENGFTYRVTGLSPNTLNLRNGNNAVGDIVIPETVTFGGFTFSITVINGAAFRDDQITSVTIPASITNIGSNAFRDTTLTSVTSNNPTAPTLGGNIFRDTPDNIALTIPLGSEASYDAAGWSTSFATVNGELSIGYAFEANGFTYRITGSNPTTVSLINRNTTLADIVIPETVNFLNTTFTITEIGDFAFRFDAITSVTIPSTVTNIGIEAFEGSSLTEIIIPDSVTDIGFGAFASLPNLTTVTLGRNVIQLSANSFNSPAITTVTYINSNPDALVSGQNRNVFGNRDASIDLIIPLGTTQTYLDRGWTNFNSITEIQVDITLAPKVFLQGAALNPNTGEETLMRDDLRIAGVIPTTSPYGDGATVNASVFNITGANAIVDWVFVELRDATDNTTVVQTKSGLLQRDGDVVDESGVSILKFTAPGDDYFVTVKHRNHLGIMTATPVALLGSPVDVDFTDATNPITFGSNAQTNAGMPANTLGMWAGNVNNDNIVQYSGTDPDAPTILSQVLNDLGNFLNFSTFVVNGYHSNDVDMDGRVQYEGVAPDAPFILQNVLAHPGNFFNFGTFQIIEQLPQEGI